MSNTMRKKIDQILSNTGVSINGPEPWDIQVKDERLYAHIFAKGTLGFGEAYMDGWWECKQIDEMIARLLRHDIRSKLKPSIALVWNAVSARLQNRQGPGRAFNIGKAHYDLGNDLYKAMLDNSMTYTCGYWKDASTLDDAQEAKLDLVCKKIGLKHGDSVLDIGCGWGSFAKFAAEKYKAKVLGVTVSKEQIKLGQGLCRGLPVELRLQDYRKISGSFDHIVSLGMFEHVGYKNYRIFFEVVRRCLKDNGLFLLHTIGGNRSVHSTDPWIGKYIFPNSMLPSASQIASATEGLFVMEDWHNFGSDYDKTLMAWHSNFEKNWGSLMAHYDERFHRMWQYYLLSCAGSFRARQNQLWQIVYSKNGIINGYNSVR
ncbi:TPA: cyclopropane fatty acyl phospholipid synthase [Candidatus Uhrbacteria bacterium]|nr:cyclopropane fatty acyl phospholipid synthase [Candidatus Uhrbacteria bacterium]